MQRRFGVCKIACILLVGCPRHNEAEQHIGQQCCSALPVPYLTGEYGLWRSMGWGVAWALVSILFYFVWHFLWKALQRSEQQSTQLRKGQFLSLTPSRSTTKMIFQEWAFLSKLFFKSKPAIMNKMFIMTSHLVPAILLGVFNRIFVIILIKNQSFLSNILQI